ncbi:MAG: hypothetical protein WBD40_05605 [Tepidisphaeraceae bacterium]
MPAPISRRVVLLATFSVVAAMVAAGCESSGDSKDDGGTSISDITIPKDVELVAQGRDELSYKARLDGRIYVYDVTAETPLFTTPVQRGQRFTIAPAEDRAAIDGADVFEGSMHTRNEHKIYFLPKK